MQNINSSSESDRQTNRVILSTLHSPYKKRKETIKEGLGCNRSLVFQDYTYIGCHHLFLSSSKKRHIEHSHWVPHLDFILIVLEYIPFSRIQPPLARPSYFVIVKMHYVHLTNRLWFYFVGINKAEHIIHPNGQHLISSCYGNESVTCVYALLQTQLR